MEKRKQQDTRAKVQTPNQAPTLSTHTKMLIKLINSNLTQIFISILYKKHMETVKKAWFKDVKCAVGKQSPISHLLINTEINVLIKYSYSKERTKLGRAFTMRAHYYFWKAN